MRLKRTSVILSEDLMARIEDWRKLQADVKNRNEAITILLEQALRSDGCLKRPLPKVADGK